MKYALKIAGIQYPHDTLTETLRHLRTSRVADSAMRGPVSIHRAEDDGTPRAIILGGDECRDEIRKHGTLPGPAGR